VKGAGRVGNAKEEKTPVEPVLVVVEIPKGSRNKYEFDHGTGRFFLDRMLFSSVHYPTDYGFIPDTLAEDGDELDALVIVAEPTFPGCVIRARPVGMFDMRDEKGTDHKILAVPISDPLWNWVQRLDDVPRHLLREITHFFSVYKDLEEGKGEQVAVGEWQDREAAEAVIAAARERWARRRDGSGE